MRVLLDTHALLWFLTDDARLGKEAKRLIEESGADVLVSVASLWEIAIKHALGKLALDQSFEDTFPDQLETNAFSILGIELGHLHQLVDLPLHHRDPFDRLLIAQALAEDIPVLTRDRAFGAYPARLIWD